MFRKVSEQRYEVFGGTSLHHLLEPDQNEMYGKGRLCARITLQPGAEISFHTHENEEEMFYIEEGVCMVKDNEKEYTGHKGDVVLTQDGEGHGMYNRSDAPVELIALVLFQ